MTQSWQDMMQSNESWMMMQSPYGCEIAQQPDLIIELGYDCTTTWSMMQSSESYLGEQFLRSEEQEQEQEREQEQENQMVKTKKAPLREGPK